MFKKTAVPPLLTYKPDWDLSVTFPTKKVATIQVNAPFPDVHGKLPPGTTFCFKYNVDSHCVKPDRINETIKKVISAIELHEVDEWLRVDGKLVGNPHPTDDLSPSGSRPLPGVNCS